MSDCWEAEMVPQLVKRYMHQKSAHPLQTMQTHKCAISKSTQDSISMRLGQTAPSALRIVLKLKSEAL